jgi:hypothetical protein
MSLIVAGGRGYLSNAILQRTPFAKSITEYSIDFSKRRLPTVSDFLLLTYSPTLRNDSQAAFDDEITYYQNIIKEYACLCHILFISSTTSELTNTTYYSRAKYSIEKLLQGSSNLNWTVLRLGMIFDERAKNFSLPSMNLISAIPLTFGCEWSGTHVTNISAITRMIDMVMSQPSFFDKKVITVSSGRYKFAGLQRLLFDLPRAPILSPFALRILSIVSPRLRAFVSGEAISSSSEYTFFHSIE